MNNKYPNIIFILLIILSVVNIKLSADESKVNIFTARKNSILLEHWKIVKNVQSTVSFNLIPDSLWKPFNSPVDENLYSEGNWILKTTIDIKDSLTSAETLGLFPTKFYATAYEIYWDEIKIAQNGHVGFNKSEEKPGLFYFNFVLPPNLTKPGKHLLILRLSNYHSYSSWKWYYGTLTLGKYDSLIKIRAINGYLAFFITGILFITFLFNLFLYIKRQRRTEHLIFSLICLLLISDFLITQAPIFISFPTTYIHFEFYFYQIISLLFITLFPAFFIYLFSIPKKIIGFVLVVNLIILLFFTNIFNMFDIMSLMVLIISSLIVLWAFKLRREGSIIILIGLLLSWAAYFINIAFQGMATVMVICTTFSIAQQFAKKEKAEKEAQLKSAQLENELLKKNINPHFILNTLTSIIAWLRKDTSAAIKLIEALAEEFRTINHISALKQIPIKQEIDLCKSHLKIMSYRKGARYKMVTIDIVEDENIPPMIFHTLVENGLTHGYENKTEGTFTLQRIKNRDGVKYVISNDGDFDTSDSENSSGFGIRYIKSRLEESYPNRWELTSNKNQNGWETVIEIKDK